MKFIRSIAIAGLLVLGGTSAHAAEVTVKPGDTLWEYGQHYGIPYQEIMTTNNLTSDLILIGQKLTIPEGRSVTATSINTVHSDYSQSDIDLLASLVQAEAEGESFQGKVAVAAVVLNRVESNLFPNSIRGVIYQRGQFSPVSDGSINVRANSESYNAVYAAMKGQDPTRGALFFYNPGVNHNHWSNSRTVTAVIGNHNFTM